MQISKRDFDLVNYVIEHKNYIETAKKFNISCVRVRDICQSIGRKLRSRDKYMKVVLPYSFSKAIKIHNKPIKEALFRLSKIEE